MVRKWAFSKHLSIAKQIKKGVVNTEQCDVIALMHAQNGDQLSNVGNTRDGTLKKFISII